MLGEGDERGAREEGVTRGGAPLWRRGPRQGEALAREVAEGRGGAGDISPSEGIGVVKVVQ